MHAELTAHYRSNLGTITAGTLNSAPTTPAAGIRLNSGYPINPSWLRYLDLAATSTMPFLTHDGLNLRADGAAFFYGRVSIGGGVNPQLLEFIASDGSSWAMRMRVDPVTDNLIIEDGLNTIELGTDSGMIPRVRINTTGYVAIEAPAQMQDINCGRLTASGPVRLPNMTTAQISAIPSPQPGMMVYNTTTNTVNVRVPGSWFTLGYL